MINLRQYLLFFLCLCCTEHLIKDKEFPKSVKFSEVVFSSRSPQSTTTAAPATVC